MGYDFDEPYKNRKKLQHQIDRQSLMKQMLQPDEKLLLAKAIDQACLCCETNNPTFTNFADPLHSAKIVALLQKEKGFSLSFLLFGGYENAERLMIGFFPIAKRQQNNTEENNEKWIKLFPLESVKISFSPIFGKKLTHRDFLGSILGLGLAREKIGDLLLRQDHVMAFVASDVSDYVVFHLEKVGNVKVTVEKAPYEWEASPQIKLETMVSVASIRLDALLAAAFCLPRSKVTDCVDREKVFVNWVCVTSASKLLKEGDVVTLRGVGRFSIVSIGDVNKKGRIAVVLQKSQ